MTGGRVLAADPGFDLGRVSEQLAGLGVAVERGTPPWAGDDVVAILAGPDYAVSPADLERLPVLRVVASPSVGFDHLPVREAAERGVWTCNVPDYCIDEMADHTLALLLSLLRGIVVLDRSVRDGAWDHTAAGPLGRLADTRLGVVGFGRIGRAVAARGLVLGMEVWATDPFVSDAEIAMHGANPARLDELLDACNAVTVHVPLTPRTEGLIGRAELERLRPGSVVVNTARARLVDQDALLEALDSGRLAAAAVDVLPTEPPPPGTVPVHPRLVVNPHAAWYSPEAEEAVYRLPVESVRAVLEGREPDGALGRPRA
jgi:D-3-phosphoglycerate dehydrogenase